MKKLLNKKEIVKHWPLFALYAVMGLMGSAAFWYLLFREFSRLLADEGWAMAGAIAGLLLTFGAYFLAVLWTMFRGGDFPEWWGWDEVLTACVFAMVMSNALAFTVGMFVTCLMLHLAKMMPCAAGVAFLTALDALFLALAVMAVRGKKNAG